MIPLRRQTLRYHSGVQESPLVVTAQADNAVIIAYLAGINVIDLLAAVFLADPPRPIVVHNLLYNVRTSLPDAQRLFFFVASGNDSLPAGLFVLLARLRRTHRSAL